MQVAAGASEAGLQAEGQVGDSIGHHTFRAAVLIPGS